MLKRHVLGFALGSLLAATVASGQCQQPPQGAALSLNGSSAYVSIPDSSSFDFTRTVTIEFWLRRNNGGEVISQSDGANITSNRAFEVQANGAFFYRADGTGWLELYNDAPTGEWVHIATVIDTTVPTRKTASAAHMTSRSPRRSSHRPHRGIVTVEVSR